MGTKKIILVTGPTASGKTDRAIELALKHETEIISADSRQVFKELNIGVARPDLEQLRTVKHHFIASHSIHENYNAGIYAQEARNLINTLFETKNTVVVCGGTGLYIKALLKGLDALPERNEELRRELEIQLKEYGLISLQQRLKNSNPVKFAEIDVHNVQRVMRAIEIAESEQPAEQNIPEFNYAFDLETILLEHPREILYERINLRVDAMISAGLENEVRSLILFKNNNALQTVGYKEWWPYFEGETGKEKVIEKIKQHSRNYAKRQMTWFRSNL
jgi:tRNA dimethylallyltransferase